MTLHQTMPTRNQIKLVKSLTRKKERLSNRLFIAEGRKVVAEAIQEGFEVEMLFCTKDLAQESTFKDAEVISPADMDRLTALSSGSEALAVLKLPENIPLSQSNKPWIVLDGIRDPGNLGTIIRIADWFSWGGILCSEDCVDRFNPKCVQSSMGSVFRVEVEYADLKSRMKESEGRVFLATDMQGESIWKQDVSAHSAFGMVIGSESHGISPEIMAACQGKITIPGNGAESLNAAVACGIIVAALSR